MAMFPCKSCGGGRVTEGAHVVEDDQTGELLCRMCGQVLEQCGMLVLSYADRERLEVEHHELGDGMNGRGRLGLDLALGTRIHTDGKRNPMQRLQQETERMELCARDQITTSRLNDRHKQFDTIDRLVQDLAQDAGNLFRERSGDICGVACRIYELYTSGVRRQRLAQKLDLLLACIYYAARVAQVSVDMRQLRPKTGDHTGKALLAFFRKLRDTPSIRSEFHIAGTENIDGFIHQFLSTTGLEHHAVHITLRGMYNQVSDSDFKSGRSLYVVIASLVMWFFQKYARHHGVKVPFDGKVFSNRAKTGLPTLVSRWDLLEPLLDKTLEAWAPASPIPAYWKKNQN